MSPPSAALVPPARLHGVAARIAARLTGGAVRRTGLRKVCPRCHRGGWVFVTAGRELVVLWGGPGRGWRAYRGAGAGGSYRGADLDAGLDAGELLGTDFGCGFDAAVRR